MCILCKYVVRFEGEILLLEGLTSPQNVSSIIVALTPLTSVPPRLRSHLLLLPTIRADYSDLSTRDTQFTCNWLLVLNTFTNWSIVQSFSNSLRKRLYFPKSFTSNISNRCLLVIIIKTHIFIYKVVFTEKIQRIISFTFLFLFKLSLCHKLKLKF